MDDRVICEQTEQGCADADFVQVCTSSDPNDDTVTLATIQRIVDKSSGTIETGQNWYIKTLIMEQPMSLVDAVSLARCYAERKNIAVVYSDQGQSHPVRIVVSQLPQLP